MRKDYDLIKRKTNFTIIEASRDDVLAQKRKDPDPKEAFRYYQVRYICLEQVKCCIDTQNNINNDFLLRLIVQ